MMVTSRAAVPGRKEREQPDRKAYCFLTKRIRDPKATIYPNAKAVRFDTGFHKANLPQGMPNGGVKNATFKAAVAVQFGMRQVESRWRTSITLFGKKTCKFRLN